MRFLACRFERYTSTGFKVFSLPGVFDSQERMVIWNFEGGEPAKLVQRDAIMMLLETQPERAPDLKWLWESTENLSDTDHVVLERSKFEMLLNEAA